MNMVSRTKPQYGHGVTGLQAYLDAKCDDIHQFKIIFDVKHDLEWSVALVFVDDGYPHIEIPVGEWGEMGRYMGSRSYWRSVSWQWWICHGDADYAGVGVDNQWFRSKIIEFFEGFKEQRNLCHLTMNLCPGRDAPQLDINYLVSRSVRFQTLELTSCSIQNDSLRVLVCPPETGTLSHASIPTIKLHCCPLDSTQNVVSSCLKMVHLHIESPSRLTAAAFSEVIGSTILPYPSSRLITLHIKKLGTWIKEGMNGLVSSVAEGLRVNTTLQELVLKGYRGFVSVLPIVASLCDPSSIESIVNSNHTLKSVYIGTNINRRCRCREEMEEEDLLMKCLDINVSGKSRNDIIQKKVVDFHMTTNFDVTQLDNLPLAALPQLLAIPSKLENNCLHGIFWIIKNRLELSEVRSRSI
jgi:hypothetical protein